MRVVRGSLTPLAPGQVVTIGNFDGVHHGHRALIDAARKTAGPDGVVCAYTFDPAPRDVLRPDNGIPRIQILEDKLSCLEAAGVDVTVVEAFSHEFAANTPAWFAKEVLTARLGARAVVVGWDFRFGRGREGTADGLRGWLDVPVIQVEAVELNGEVVSSSRIRKSITAGDVRSAARLLGRPHQVVGTVVAGDGRGAGLGFPTANLEAETPLTPASGVYAARVGGHNAVVNLGTRPTFGGGQRTLEVHLLDFQGDLYGQRLRVDFIDRIRDERAFPDVGALVAQITADVLTARSTLS